MVAETSLICEITVLSDCSYQSFSIWALFLRFLRCKKAWVRQNQQEIYNLF